MLRRIVLAWLVATLAAAGALGSASASAADKISFSIVRSPEASPLEMLGAREIRRYLYLRTGRTVPIRTALPREGDAIVVARKDRPLVRSLAFGADTASSITRLSAQQYLLKTLRKGGRSVVLVVGGDSVGTLYGAYRLAEHLGVRFYLHGDVVPDGRIALRAPEVAEIGKPLFALRGIQPFHDFPEGPDWWNLDDYKAIISQLPKLRMNFIGLHTYPEGHPNAEPTVWIGLPEDVGERGRVKFAYPASYQNTLRGNWGYQAKKTSRFHLGAAQLFERDAYGADVMEGLCPRPQTPDECNELFDRVGEMLRESFRWARRLGVKTCVGTETPLTVPERVGKRLRERGLDPSRPEAIAKLYEGIFLRAERAYRPDFYWFWTPEGWTWRGTSQKQVEATVSDINLAIEAARRVGASFRLATCGWVLGPPHDRALFGKILPPQVAVSCINRNVGNSPVEPAFARIKGRAKWAIPWLEDDPGLTAPQLWVGRMRRDAADSLKYGCTGLMGIHWRTRILGPNVLALARAAWDQSAWNKPEERKVRLPDHSGPVGGKVARFPRNPIAGTDDDPLYQTVRYDVSAYRLLVPNGLYEVTLKFCEPHYAEKGRRVFGVAIQGKKVIDRLDIFAKVGRNRALDFTFPNVRVTTGLLDIEFLHEVEFPSIAAIAVEGKGFGLKINCGGGAYKDYVADPPPLEVDQRYFPAGDFYRDWALCQFGREVAEEVAEIFGRLDCHLPRPAQWVGGPGGLKPDARRWEKVRAEYAFVDELAALRRRVRGRGGQARFDYWLNNFRYMRAMARVRCLWARYNEAMKKVEAEKSAEAKRDLARRTALPLRKELVGAVREVYRHLLSTVSNTGEMGTLANWEQHILPSLLEKPGERLARILGEPLPPDATLPMEFEGEPRIIVATVRAAVEEGEALDLKVIILSRRRPRSATLYWRPMGEGGFAERHLSHVARSVYSVSFPPGGARAAALEYYVVAAMPGGEKIYFPPTAPQINQTVVVMPRAGSDGK